MDEQINDEIKRKYEVISNYIENLEFKKACNEIIELIEMGNKYYDERKPWIQRKENIEEFNNNNKDIVYVRAPKVYNNLVTTKVLVMENIDGITINNVLKLNEYGYDLNEIGLKVSDNYIKQAIDDGFFHADPHPDNLFINEGKIVYLDFGMVGKLNTRNNQLPQHATTKPLHPCNKHRLDRRTSP